MINIEQIQYRSDLIVRKANLKSILKYIKLSYEGIPENFTSIVDIIETDIDKIDEVLIGK